MPVGDPPPPPVGGLRIPGAWPRQNFPKVERTGVTFMEKKIQSVGNLMASASYKPGFTTAKPGEKPAAFGYLQIGEILRLPEVRLFQAQQGDIGAEIPGGEATAQWEPWAMCVRGGPLTVRRSTSWDDRHVQWWECKGVNSLDEMVVWLKFELYSPGTVEVELDAGRARIWWKTALDDVVGLEVSGAKMLAVAAGGQETAVKQQLQGCGSQSVVSPKAAQNGPWAGVAGVRMAAAEQGRLLVALGRSRLEVENKLLAMAANPEDIVRQAQAQWNNFFKDEVPPCPSTAKRERALWAEAWYVLRANRMEYGQPPLTRPFGSPSKFNYTHQWLWDSGFQAIVWRWAKAPKFAEEELANLLENPQENGRISHEILYSPWKNWDPASLGRRFVPTSQPPVLAMAVEKVYARTGNLAWLRRVWPQLHGYLHWWHIARDPDADSLAGWASGWESGLDDSPRWDHVPRSGPGGFFPAPVEAVELNALLVNEWNTLGRIGRLLGENAQAADCVQKAGRIRAAMREKMWDQGDGFFYCRDHQDRPIRIKTVGGLLGLLALEKGDHEISALVGHLRDAKEFWTEYPVPSVACDESTFSPRQMWRGPTWVNTNWLLIRALSRLGELDTAAELARRTLSMATSQGRPVLGEWYDPCSGEGLGNMDYGWSTLVIDLLMDPVRVGQAAGGPARP